MSEKGDVPRRLDARYANDFRVGFNRDEFIVDIGQSFEGTEAFYWRIVCTPALIQTFVLLLQKSLEDYAREYGSSPTTEEP